MNINPENTNNLTIDNLLKLAEKNSSFNIDKSEFDLIIKETKSNTEFMNSLLELIESNPHLIKIKNQSNNKSSNFDLIIQALLSPSSNTELEFGEIKFDLSKDKKNPNLSDNLNVNTSKRIRPR